MKYRLFILVIILFITGCSASYDLEINKDNSSLETIVFDKIDYSSDEINSIVDEYNINNIKTKYENNRIILKRESPMYYNLNNDYAIMNYFGNIKINKDKISFKPNYDKCIFLFSDGGEYISDDKININVKIPFKVTSSNADKIDVKTYTWTYTINNCNKEIYVELSNSNISIFSIIVCVFFIAMVVLLVIYKKKSNNYD